MRKAGVGVPTTALGFGEYDFFLSHFQATGGDQVMLLYTAPAHVAWDQASPAIAAAKSFAEKASRSSTPSPTPMKCTGN